MVQEVIVQEVKLEVVLVVLQADLQQVQYVLHLMLRKLMVGREWRWHRC